MNPWFVGLLEISPCGAKAKGLQAWRPASVRLLSWSLWCVKGAKEPKSHGLRENWIVYEWLTKTLSIHVGFCNMTNLISMSLCHVSADGLSSMTQIPYCTGNLWSLGGGNDGQRTQRFGWRIHGLAAWWHECKSWKTWKRTGCNRS